MAKRKPKGSRWASEAAQQTLLRFGPQIDALSQIQKEAEGAYATSVAQARGNADALTATIDQARPEISGVYDAAGLDQARTASVVNNDIASLPGLSDNLKAAVGLEQANASSRVSSGRAQALTGLSQQKVAARAGGAYAANKAHDDLVSQLSKIFDQRTSLGSQAGTFQSLTTSQLQDKATARADTLASQQAGRNQSERNSVRSSGVDPDTGLPIPGGKLDPKAKPGKGPKLNPAGAHQSAREAVQKALATLGTLDPDRTDRHHTAPLLVEGQKPIKFYEADGKTPKMVTTSSGDKRPKVSPEIPGVGEWATIAADVYYDGHLSRKNQRKLQQQHYSIKQLGLPTYREWKKAGGRSPAAGVVDRTTRAIGTLGR